MRYAPVGSPPGAHLFAVLVDRGARVEDIGEHRHVDDVGAQGHIDDVGERGGVDDVGERGGVDDVRERGGVDDVRERGGVDDVHVRGRVGHVGRIDHVGGVEGHGHVDDIAAASVGRVDGHHPVVGGRDIAGVRELRAFGAGAGHVKVSRDRVLEPA
jgi:hypothetical protein